MPRGVSKPIERLPFAPIAIAGSFALRPEDVLVINVPLDTPTEVCDEFTTNLPDNLKGRVVVVRAGVKRV